MYLELSLPIIPNLVMPLVGDVLVSYLELERPTPFARITLMMTLSYLHSFLDYPNLLGSSLD